MKLINLFNLWNCVVEFIDTDFGFGNNRPARERIEATAKYIKEVQFFPCSLSNYIKEVR